MDENAPTPKPTPAAVTKTISRQPSWIIRNYDVELAITQLGGHMAPVTFYRRDPSPVQPYYMSPWQGERLALDDAVLRPLRGDFFCLPFCGGTDPARGERFPAHGESATSPWTLAELEKSRRVTTLVLTLDNQIRPGKITKRLSLVKGENVVYSRHVLDGFSGRMPLGHHAILAVPEAEGSLRVATSPFELGMTNPTLFSDPAKGEYQSLAINQRFTDLRHVPLIWKDPSEADCTSFPARTGFADLVGLYKRPTAETPAWTAVTNQAAGYVWFSLKDSAMLPATLFWIENRGRHAAPWNGRNRCLGIEDVCSYFASGMEASLAPNEVAEAGFPTAYELSPDRPTAVNYIQGVVRIPADFGVVESLEFTRGHLTFVSTTGARVTAPVHHEFIKSGEL
jgi:hypothetical protein